MFGTDTELVYCTAMYCIGYTSRETPVPTRFFHVHVEGSSSHILLSSALTRKGSQGGKEVESGRERGSDDGMLMLILILILILMYVPPYSVMQDLRCEM